MGICAAFIEEPEQNPKTPKTTVFPVATRKPLSNPLPYPKNPS